MSYKGNPVYDTNGELEDSSGDNDMRRICTSLPQYLSY